MYNVFCRHSLFVQGQSFSVKFLTARARLPGNWRGAGKRFSGAFRAGAPSPLACHLLVPTTSKRMLCRLIPFQTSYPAIK